jgi:hypothetical protein
VHGGYHIIGRFCGRAGYVIAVLIVLHYSILQRQPAVERATCFIPCQSCSEMVQMFCLYWKTFQYYRVVYLHMGIKPISSS